MTDKRFKQLSDLNRWYWGEVREIEKLHGYNYPEAQARNHARDVLTRWRAEKSAAINATQAEWDEYEFRNECEIERQEDRRDHEMRYGEDDRC